MGIHHYIFSIRYQYTRDLMLVAYVFQSLAENIGFRLYFIVFNNRISLS